MNDVKIFESPEFGQVRTTVIGGEPWFVAADVCRALDLGNPTRALDRLDDDERTLISIKGASNGKPVNGVNRITRTTKVTGKGQVYFVNKFLNGSKAVLE